MKPKGVRGQKRKAVLNESSDDEVVFNVPESKKVKTDEEQNEEQKSCDIKEQTLTTKDPEPLPEIKTEEDEIEFKPRRSPNGYILADPLPKGLVIQDQRKKRWKIGKSVGLGGFGEIYSAALYDGETFRILYLIISIFFEIICIKIVKDMISENFYLKT